MENIDALSPHHKAHVTSYEEGMRLQRWLQRHFPSLSYSALQKCLRQKRILVDKTPVNGNISLKAGQEIELIDQKIQSEEASRVASSFSEEETVKYEHQLRNLILYEDAQCCALNKPAGLAVQGGSKVYCSVDTLLKGHFALTKEYYLLVHRLDKMTSGLLLIAKGRAVAEYFRCLFQEHRIRKTYLAITDGVPHPPKGRISAPIIKKRFGGEERVVINSEIGQPAETDYRVLKAYTSYALLALYPLTGRTHQLRVHCSAVLGTPIVGDIKYGTVQKASLHTAPKENVNLLLHAYQLHVPNLPILTAPVPESFSNIANGNFCTYWEEFA
ncbi:MAG: RluA family pseudouridine synthase [Holosporales bacterium]|jgi:23S rRNA pseudouridine955/2504/2580 synthase|nr:RluA family pseudouridine synthase [Holosporales bacterium]